MSEAALANETGGGGGGKGLIARGKRGRERIAVDGIISRAMIVRNESDFCF